MSGRPPSTVEGQVKALTRRLRTPNGDMGTLERLAIMRNLLGQADGQARYSGEPDPALLMKLAAHCVVWAEALEGADDADA